MPFNVHPTLAKDSILAAKVGSLQIRLMDDSRYFWLIIVPETDTTELHQLDSDLSNELWGLVRHLGQKLKDHTRADKINNAAIGNLVPQLHFHVVARHKSDPDWPKPIGGLANRYPCLKPIRHYDLRLFKAGLAICERHRHPFPVAEPTPQPLTANLHKDAGTNHHCALAPT